MKTMFKLSKRIRCFPSTLRNNHRSLWLCVRRNLGQGNHVIIVTSPFSKSSVFKLFSVYTKGFFIWARSTGLARDATFFYSGQNGINFVMFCNVFLLLGVCELALLVKLQESTMLWQPVANNTSLYIFHHFGCVSWIHPGRPGRNFPYEHTTEFVPVTGLIWRGP